MKITDLPEFMLMKIRKYCYFDDYLCLMNAAKTAFHYIKRNTVFYCLTPDASRQFVLEETFRQRIYQNISDPRKQIKLKITPVETTNDELAFPPYPLPVQYFIYNDEADIDETSNLYLTFTAVEKVSHFCSTTIQKLSPWPYLRVISFYNCEVLEDLSALLESPHLETVKLVNSPHVKDLSPLINLSKVVIIHCAGVEDYSILGKQRTLEIAGVTQPLDVTNFRSVRKLVLRENRELLNYSELNTIHELTIKHCPSVLDLRQLKGKHHSLTLAGSYFLPNYYEMLDNIQEVRLKNCQITTADLVYVHTAKILSFNHCPLIDDLSGLISVKRLEIVNCVKVTTLPTLPQVRLLRFEGSGIIPPFYRTEIWPALHTLAVKGQWFRTPGVEVLGNIRNLTIHSFNKIESVLEGLAEWFPHLRTITIQSCLYLRSAKGLENIAEITIEDCRMFASVEGLGGAKNHRIKISRCSSLKDISPLVNVPIVIISGCDKVRDLSAFANHSRFRISYC